MVWSTIQNFFFHFLALFLLTTSPHKVLICPRSPSPSRAKAVHGRMESAFNSIYSRKILCLHQCLGNLMASAERRVDLTAVCIRRKFINFKIIYWNEEKRKNKIGWETNRKSVLTMVFNEDSSIPFEYKFINITWALGLQGESDIFDGSIDASWISSRSCRTLFVSCKL